MHCAKFAKIFDLIAAQDKRLFRNFHRSMKGMKDQKNKRVDMQISDES